VKILNVQQGTQPWIEARLGIPTASNFDKIITPKELKLAAGRHAYRHRLLAEWITLESQDNEFQNVAMERGTELEDRARAWYSLHRGVEVMEVGFCLRDDGKVGCSPDGLTEDGGGLEIKCPMAPKCVAYLTGDEKLDEAHRLQVMGGLWVTGLPWWDVLAWNPAMNRIPPTLIRVLPDPKVFAALDEHIGTFLAEFEMSKAYLIETKKCQPKGKPVSTADLIR